MANEITITTGMTVTKNSTTNRYDVLNEQHDMTGSIRVDNVQTIGTTYEAIYKGDIGTIGFAQFTNLDSTNYVDIGREISAAFEAFIRVMPGKTSPPIKTSALTALYGRANTAACNVRCVLIEA